MNKQEKHIILPSANGKISKRLIWNLYREHNKKIHYYHLRPFDSRDKLIRENINPSVAISLIEKYNKDAKPKRKNCKILPQK